MNEPPEELKREQAMLDEMQRELDEAAEGRACECSADEACRIARERDDALREVAELKQQLKAESARLRVARAGRDALYSRLQLPREKRADNRQQALSEVVAELRKLWPRSGWAKVDDPQTALHEIRYGGEDDSEVAP